MRTVIRKDVFETNKSDVHRIIIGKETDMREFKITENAVKNLITTYADHYLMCEELENEIDEDDLYDDADYSHHSACCATAEDWMRVIEIHPESNFVIDIINKERERR